MRKSYYTHWLVNCQTTDHISPDDIYRPLHPTLEDGPMDKKTEADLLAHEFRLNLGPDGKIIKKEQAEK